MSSILNNENQFIKSLFATFSDYIGNKLEFSIKSLRDSCFEKNLRIRVDLLKSEIDFHINSLKEEFDDLKNRLNEKLDSVQAEILSERFTNEDNQDGSEGNENAYKKLRLSLTSNINTSTANTSFNSLVSTTVNDSFTVLPTNQSTINSITINDDSHDLLGNINHQIPNQYNNYAQIPRRQSITNHQLSNRYPSAPHFVNNTVQQCDSIQQKINKLRRDTERFYRKSKSPGHFAVLLLTNVYTNQEMYNKSVNGFKASKTTKGKDGLDQEVIREISDIVESKYGDANWSKCVKSMNQRLRRITDALDKNESINDDDDVYD